MQVYIEYVISNNLLANYMILYLVASILRRRTRWWRMLISSILGTIYAVFLPFISFQYDVFIKVLLSIIMVLVAYKHNSIRAYMSSIVAFYLTTFLMGGVIIGVGNIFNYDLVNVLLYPNSYYPSLLAIAIIVITMLIRLFTQVYTHHMHRASCYFDVVLRVGNRSVTTRGYLDTGNRLYYRMSPVIILDKCIFMKIFDDNVIKNSSHYINIKTINNNTMSKAFRIDNVDIIQDGKHREYKGIYAIQSMREFEGYHILLHSDM